MNTSVRKGQNLVHRVACCIVDVVSCRHLQESKKRRKRRNATMQQRRLAPLLRLRSRHTVPHSLSFPLTPSQPQPRWWSTRCTCLPGRVATQRWNRRFSFVCDGCCRNTRHVPIYIHARYGSPRSGTPDCVWHCPRKNQTATETPFEHEL